MSGTEAILEMRHIGKYFGANVVLRDVNFSVREGEVTCIIGASGSGKSTLLRYINLLEMPTSGEILYRGENILKPDMDSATKSSADSARKASRRCSASTAAQSRNCRE